MSSIVEPSERGAKAAFLDRLSPGDRQELLALGRSIRLRPGATGLVEGQVSGQVLLVLRGHVAARSTSPDGRVSLLAVRCSGEVVGEESAVDGRPHSATVSALDQVEAVAIPASAFRTFVRTHADVAMALLELITERLRDSDRMRAEFGSMDTTARVAARLAELAEVHGEVVAGAIRIGLSLSQEEMASWVGSSREAVSRALRLFRVRGWISTRRRGITVLDHAALRARAA